MCNLALKKSADKLLNNILPDLVKIQQKKSIDDSALYIMLYDFSNFFKLPDLMIKVHCFIVFNKITLNGVTETVHTLYA